MPFMMTCRTWSRLAARAFLDIIGACVTLGLGLIKLFDALALNIATVLVSGILSGINKAIEAINTLMTTYWNSLPATQRTMFEAAGINKPTIPTLDVKSMTAGYKEIWKTTSPLSKFASAADDITAAVTEAIDTLSKTYLANSETASTATEEQQKFGAMLNSTSQCVSQTAEASKYFNATLEYNRNFPCHNFSNNNKYSKSNFIEFPE